MTFPCALEAWCLLMVNSNIHFASPRYSSFELNEISVPLTPKENSSRANRAAIHVSKYYVDPFQCANQTTWFTPSK